MNAMLGLTSCHGLGKVARRTMEKGRKRSCGENLLSGGPGHRTRSVMTEPKDWPRSLGQMDYIPNVMLDLTLPQLGKRWQGRQWEGADAKSLTRLTRPRLCPRPRPFPPPAHPLPLALQLRPQHRRQQEQQPYDYGDCSNWDWDMMATAVTVTTTCQWFNGPMACHVRNNVQAYSGKK